MSIAPELILFNNKIKEAFEAATFVKMTLSKAMASAGDLQNIYVRPVVIKGAICLSFTYRHKTQDIVKNYNLVEAQEVISNLAGTDFLHLTLFTTKGDIVLKYNKKRKARLLTNKASFKEAPMLSHDKTKKRYIETKNNAYLKALGITNQAETVKKEGQRKFRQINKYIEIIDGVLRKNPLPKGAHIVDMGCGKGYLTFALYDFLKNNIDENISITGIELRENLVTFCNELVQQTDFKQLQFLAKDIYDYHPDKINMLIALHACDIATDIAIAKGIKAGAEVIIVAPCCHKQIRKQMNCNNAMQSILQHGILEERQAELVTDGIRALLMEVHGYQTKVFEFISTEHTAKNLMIVGTKAKPKPELLEEIKAIKAQFGIVEHYLESLL